MPWIETWVKGKRTQRWVNEFPRIRMTLPVAARAIHHYVDARSLGHSQKESVAYATAQIEKYWHSSGGIDLEKSHKRGFKNCRWFKSKKAHKHPGKFLRVLRNTLGKEVKLADLDGMIEDRVELLMNRSTDRFRDTIVKEFMLENLNQEMPVVIRAKKAIENCKKVYPDVHDDLWSWINGGRYCREWCKIKRGKDLFIKGWGGFDLEAARRYKNTLPDIMEIQGRGYGIGSKWSMESILKNQPVMQYITRWIQWWRTEDEIENRDEHGTTRMAPRMALVDELLRIRSDEVYDLLPEHVQRSWQQMHPDTLLRYLGDAERAVQQRYERDDIKLEDEYPWVDQVMGVVDVSQHVQGGVLVPVTTRDRLESLGKIMDCCVDTYARYVQQKQCMIVELQQPDSQVPGAWKTIALCEYRKGGEIVQARGHGNSKVGIPVEDAFRSVQPKW